MNHVSANQLEQQAARVLGGNNRGSHTIPSPSNYPHQWLWDSCFIAVGLTHLDPQKAAAEVTTLLSGQWANGMVPHMLFSESKPVDGPKFMHMDHLLWDSKRNPQAPKHIFTSGITQPPLIAEAVWRVSKKLNNKERKQFLEKTIKRLIKYHEWIYAERDFNGNGLMSAVHPWETGMDNSPPLINHMHGKHIDFLSTAENMAVSGMVKAVRRDAKETHLDERTLSGDAFILAAAAWKLRRTKYDHQEMRHHANYIEDVALNSILVRNNMILGELAEASGVELPDELLANMRRTEESLDKVLWDEETQMYYSRDARSSQLLNVPTVGSLLPLYAGTIDKAKVSALVAHLREGGSFAAQYGVPSVPIGHPEYEEKRMWSGPAWVNMNWLLIDGLVRAGYEPEADGLTEKTLKMVQKGGMHEYFSAQTGEGLGIDNFSWTAALTIDLLKSRRQS